MADYDVKYWQEQITVSEKELEKFHESGAMVVEHYLDTFRAATEAEGIGAHKVNMFWANVGILKSALYGNPPKPIAVREFQDPEDDVARVAAAIIERLLRTGPNGSGKDMHEAFEHSVEDRLIPGLGQVWLRYDATTQKVAYSGVQVEQITDENVPCDYIYWRDFFYSPCRVWEECYWVARRVWMTSEALKRRFPKCADKIPLVIPKDGKSYAVTAANEHSSLRRGEIFEIWCKTTKKVHWIAKGCEEMLDEKDDQLQIPGFFPCPKPLIANSTTTKFIGRADYTMVQDQYSQLNSINVRLGYLIEACKAVGVYDKTAEGVQRMLNQATENQLIPVDNWAMFAEKGGIKGVVDWLPIEAVVAVIEKLREARVDVVQQIYELTGISDIMRGVTNARETYGAQQLKAQYSSSRLQLYQLQVGAFVAGAMDIKASIIAKHWQPETIMKKSLIQYTPDREFADQAIQLIKNSWELMYRINVSSTQMSIPDYNAEKQMRQEYVTTMGQYIGQITPALEKAPSAAPFMLRILQWAGASFATSGGVETLFDNYIREVEKQLKAPAGKSPEQAAAEAEAMKVQAQAQSDMQLANVDASVKKTLADIDARVKFQIAQMESETKDRISKRQAAVDLEIAGLKQSEMFGKEAEELKEREQELEEERRGLEREREQAEFKIQSIIDAATQEVKVLADKHELAVKESIMKAQAEATKKENQADKKDSKADISSMQKMHTDLMSSVAVIMKGMKEMQSGGAKSISITLPDGKQAKATVTPTKE